VCYCCSINFRLHSENYNNLRFARVQNASGQLRRGGGGTHPENVDYLYTFIDSSDSDRADTRFYIVHERIKVIQGSFGSLITHAYISVRYEVFSSGLNYLCSHITCPLSGASFYYRSMPRRNIKFHNSSNRRLNSSI